jgi:iron complex transport system substrate-binding protein
VVATVAYSDEPAAASRLPRIGDSEAIDLERLILLRPDVVVVWPSGNSAPQLARLRGMGLPLYGQQVDRLADLAPALRRLGVLTGRSASAELAAARVEQQLRLLRMSFASQKSVSVLLQVWSHPVYTVGGRQLLTDVLAVCGARNVFADLPEAGPAVSIEAVLARDPQVIVAAGPAEAAASWLAEWRAYPTLSAVRSQNLIAFSDPRLTRLGPSVLPATAALCEALGRARAATVPRG